MFTGIITGIGHIVTVNDLGDTALHGKRLTLACPPHYLDCVAVGDSMALNGACMTVTTLSVERQQFTVDVSAESLAATTGLDRPGLVNLEKALRAQDHLGGHIVTGHVDGVGLVSHLLKMGESLALHLLVPPDLAPYLAYKGSVAVNGVSLTVNRVSDKTEGCHLQINLIPHTVQNTTLHTLQTGASVNLEIDLIARYIRRMLETSTAFTPQSVASTVFRMS